MNSLKLNSEYLRRHVFSILVFLGIGCWFAYDGFVKYPATDAVKLYVSIEGAEPPAGYDVEKFKSQKTKSQKIFALFLFVSSLVGASRLTRNFLLKFSWSEEGFEHNGKKYTYSDIAKIDDSHWEKRSTLVIFTKSEKILLDAWHHVGVSEFKEFLNTKKSVS